MLKPSLLNDVLKNKSNIIWIMLTPVLHHCISVTYRMCSSKTKHKTGYTHIIFPK